MPKIELARFHSSRAAHDALARLRSSLRHGRFRACGEWALGVDPVRGQHVLTVTVEATDTVESVLTLCLAAMLENVAVEPAAVLA